MCNCDLCEKQHHEKSLEFFKAAIVNNEGKAENINLFICHICLSEYSEDELNEKLEVIYRGV